MQTTLASIQLEFITQHNEFLPPRRRIDLFGAGQFAQPGLGAGSNPFGADQFAQLGLGAGSNPFGAEHSIFPEKYRRQEKIDFWKTSHN